MKQKTVFVALSGGVDSSVAALRLKRQGYNVVGVFIKVWQPDFLVCNWEQERLDAMHIAAHLDIPFLTHDAAIEYKKEVADYMIDTYKRGETPNPDVMCNKSIKFGSFMKFALGRGADKIATGHYAQIKESNGTYHLLRGKDTKKDQSYFLWTLTQDQLSKTLFPIGDTLKEDVRREAKRANLPVFDKKDSQGICFLGNVNINKFLSHFIDIKPGNVLDENGEIIGEHSGALLYTTGQRHGFTVITHDTVSTPRYVVKRNIEANTITVSHTQPKATLQTQLKLSQVNVIKEVSNRHLVAQCRYRQKPSRVTLSDQTTDGAILNIDEKNMEQPSVGQSCVLYDGIECIGGGIITE